jgi:transcriptional regulator with XRE-family HTH domain
MVIGQKLRELREAKNMSQGDIERRTGLIRAYTSRVENGHTVPGVTTLEKYAGALEIPLYRFFTDGPVNELKLPPFESDAAWGSSGKDRREFHLFAKAFTRMSDRDRNILLVMAQKMASRHAKPTGRALNRPALAVSTVSR